MARVVREIMNPELFSITATSRASDTLEAILDYGITAAPVLDDERRPIGMTSIRDLLRADDGGHIVSPALSVGVDATIEDAASTMAESGVHHLVVVAGDGRAVGMLSSLDLLRALVGLPAGHPATFPHFDPELGVAWSDMKPFDALHVEAARNEPGVLVLTSGGVGRTECDLWVEASAGLRSRFVEMLAAPEREPLALARILARRDLRFRFATIDDPRIRGSVARRVRERIDGAPLPRDVSPVA